MRNTLPIAPQAIHSGSCVATTIIGRAVTIQAARSSMWKGDLRVLAAALDSGACRHAEAVSTPRPSASFLPILFWQDRKEWAAGGTVAVLPHFTACRWPTTPPSKPAVLPPPLAQGRLWADRVVRPYGITHTADHKGHRPDIPNIRYPDSRRILRFPR